MYIIDDNAKIYSCMIIFLIYSMVTQIKLQLVRTDCIKFASLPYFCTHLSSTPLMPQLKAQTAL
jgi:hypothetical protein